MGHFLEMAKSIKKQDELNEINEKSGFTLSERYRPKYPEGQCRDKELAEIVDRVHREGFVLLWSRILEDFVAFYRDEEARGKIPPGFVPYRDNELSEIFGKQPMSRDKLKLIHEAKKLSGCVVENETSLTQEGD